MTVRGTRIISGKEARLFSGVERKVSDLLRSEGFEEVRIPSLKETATFVEKAGEEIRNQMYAFTDKGDRDICLIPEVTGVLQEQWNAHWSKSKPKPYRIFYIERCYRYERPQRGRYREFTQLGIEIFGGSLDETSEEAQELLVDCLDLFDVDYEFDSQVERGLSYYVEDGFEARIPSLGAQEQIAGGGAYEEGVGWAIGLDRFVLALLEEHQ